MERKETKAYDPVSVLNQWLTQYYGLNKESKGEKRNDNDNRKQNRTH